LNAAPPPEKGASESQTTLPPELVELIDAHNRERAEAKLKPLAANEALITAARIHARDMAEHESMSHEGSDGSKPNERITKQGYEGRRTGENIAWGQKSVPEVMKTWTNSPPHRANILGDFSEIGVAREVSARGGPYWCVTFGLSWPKLDEDKASQGLVDALNQARSGAGRPPLKVNPKLAEAAQKLAQDLSTRSDLAGRNPDDPSPDDRVLQTGYRFLRLGEAAASGQTSADAVVKTWLDSPPHREQFLGPFTEIGVGFANTDKGVPVWTVFLAEPAR
jgi:uncharacterized protein YkwD